MRPNRAKPGTASPGACGAGTADAFGLAISLVGFGVALDGADGDAADDGTAVVELVGRGVAVDAGVGVGEAVEVGNGEGDGDGVGVGVGVGATQRGSMVKRATRCSTNPSRWVTRQYIAYLPGASSGIPLK